MTKALRMRRLFGGDGRMLLVAMDHAAYMGPAAGLDLVTISRVVASGADAVMTTFGTARRASAAPEVLGAAALVLSLDVHAPEPEEQVLNAVRLGADSAKVLAASGEREQWTALQRYALICERWGLPFQAEVIPGVALISPTSTPPRTSPACVDRRPRWAPTMSNVFTQATPKACAASSKAPPCPSSSSAATAPQMNQRWSSTLRTRSAQAWQAWRSAVTSGATLIRER